MQPLTDQPTAADILRAIHELNQLDGDIFQLNKTMESLKKTIKELAVEFIDLSPDSLKIYVIEINQNIYNIKQTLDKIQIDD